MLGGLVRVKEKNELSENLEENEDSKKKIVKKVRDLIKMNYYLLLLEKLRKYIRKRP